MYSHLIFTQPSEVGTIIIFISEKGKVNLRPSNVSKVVNFKVQTQNLNLRYLSPKSMNVITICICELKINRPHKCEVLLFLLQCPRKITSTCLGTKIYMRKTYPSQAIT